MWRCSPSAAVGMGVGAGQFLLTGAGVALVLVLWVCPVLERRIDNLRHVRPYEVICPVSHETYDETERIFLDPKVQVLDSLRTKKGDRLICTWRIIGSP